MRLRRAIPFGVAVIVLLGSLAVYGQMNSDPSSAAQMTATPASAVANPTHVVGYENLSANRQEIFELAIGSDGFELPSDHDEDFWIDNSYVRFEGELYHVLVAVP